MILTFIIEKYANRLLTIYYPKKTLLTHAGFSLFSFHTENTAIKEVANCKNAKQKWLMETKLIL